MPSGGMYTMVFAFIVYIPQAGILPFIFSRHPQAIARVAAKDNGLSPHGPSMASLVAIDPGLHGAIAVLSPSGITAVTMPLAGGSLDLPAIASIIRDTSPQWVILEKVASRPGQGVASTFKFGQGYGSILGIAAALAVPVELVAPQRWKGAILHGTAKDKAAAIAYCRRAFPDVSLVPQGCRVAHDGLADSLCLLEYGRRCVLAAAA